MNELDDGVPSRRSRLLPRSRWLILIALVLACAGCVGQVKAPVRATYAEAKQRYLEALERDLGLAAQFSRLAPIPSFTEPSRPGAVFKKGNPRPLHAACLVPPDRLPEPKEVAELWSSGPPPRFRLLEESLPPFLKTAMQKIPRINLAVTQSATAMPVLADTSQVLVSADDLKQAFRNEACLQAILGQEVLVVRGLLTGADAVLNSRYFDAGSGEEVLKDEHIRALQDASGHFYVQETDPKPKYWVLSAWQVKIAIVPEPTTPEQRAAALKNFLASNHGSLVVVERRPTDQEVQGFLDDLVSLTKHRTTGTAATGRP